MFEINPVLAGTTSAPDYVPSQNNIATTQASAMSDASAVDPRRYTKFDTSVTEAGTATNFKFSDLVDMLNPLQHIPVLSAAYRAVTNEPINPVSRVAGDILYGGLAGGASALLGAVGSIGDTIVEAQTGNSTAGNIMQALFEPSPSPAAVPEPVQPVEVASLDPTPPPTEPVVTEAVVPSPSATSPASANQASVSVPPPAVADPAPLLMAKAFPLDRAKLTFGGVTHTGSVVQPQNIPRFGHTIYTGRLTTGVNPATVAAAAPAEQPAQPVILPALQPLLGQAAPATLGQSALPQALMDNMMMMKALSQYKNTAAQSVSTGSSNAGSRLDLVN